MASIQIVKYVVSVSGDTAFKYMLYPGDVIAYSFTITNTGNVELTNVMISDPGSDVSGGTIPSLQPGESDSSTFSATHTVTKADLETGQYTNTVTVTGVTPNGDTVTDQDSATVEKAQLY